MRTALALVLGSLLVVPVVPAAAADVPAADKVVIGVVVKDKKDVVVPDLRPEEIEVTENGSKRPVEAVRFVKPGETAEGVTSPGSLISLVFSGMDVNQQKRAQQAVEELLKHDLGPSTQIGVFRIGLQLWTVQPFTSDLALVRQGTRLLQRQLFLGGELGLDGNPVDGRGRAFLWKQVLGVLGDAPPGVERQVGVERQCLQDGGQFDDRILAE